MSLEKRINTNGEKIKSHDGNKFRNRIAIIIPFLLLVCVFSLGALIKFIQEEKNESNGVIIEDIKGMQSQSTETREAKIDVTSRSPLNGIPLTDEQFYELREHIPYAVMISNNDSARIEQYGISKADIVYEAQVEGGITRFMGIFWSGQEEFTLKPIRSVRKYFFDWATEYGNIPVTFTGFATTDNYDTNSFGFAREQGIRVTYYDWPFVKDTQCAAILPAMHCKYTSPQLLYDVFEKHGWTYDSWSGMSSQNVWQFNADLYLKPSYEMAYSVTYDFAWTNEWTSRWEYDKASGFYKKFDPENIHIDNETGEQIAASTLIIQKLNRSYTYDAEGHVIYETTGQGEAAILRDGYGIPAIWEKPCYTCRTKFYGQGSVGRGDEIELKPGLIWIAAVPKDARIVFGKP